jgi:hypothetical protein
VPSQLLTTNPLTTNQIKDIGAKAPRTKFVKPTIEEIRNHIAEKGYHFNADAFFAYYESNGWKVGRNPVKSWQACCVTWNTNKFNAGTAQQQPKPRKELTND